MAYRFVWHYAGVALMTLLLVGAIVTAISLRHRLVRAEAFGEERTRLLRLERVAASVPAEAYLYDFDVGLGKIDHDSLEKARADLIRYIWKGLNLAGMRPSAIKEGSRRNVFAGIADTANVSTFEYLFPNGINEFTEVAQHEKGASCLVIWAQGHEGAPGDNRPMEGGANFLRSAWEKGCDLIVQPMALRGTGNVTVVTPKYGPVWIGANHDGLQLLETAEFSAFRIFFEPLYATLNKLQETRQYARIAMAGVSGGGWMSTVYPAIDTRISFSVAVAGSFPMHLRYLPTDGSFRDLGDWEQHYAPIYRIATYFDLYLLGAKGEGRKQTLVFNIWDPCCFAAARAMTFLPKLQERARAIGIPLAYIIDGNHHEHDLSSQTGQLMLSEFLGNDPTVTSSTGPAGDR